MSTFLTEWVKEIDIGYKFCKNYRNNYTIKKTYIYILIWAEHKQRICSSGLLIAPSANTSSCFLYTNRCFCILMHHILRTRKLEVIQVFMLLSCWLVYKTGMCILALWIDKTRYRLCHKTIREAGIIYIHTSVSALSSSFSQTLKQPRCRKDRFDRPFILTAVTLYNSSVTMSWVTWTLWSSTITTSCIKCIFHIYGPVHVYVYVYLYLLCMYVCVFVLVCVHIHVYTYRYLDIYRYLLLT